MDRDRVLQYRARWQAVVEVEDAERQQADIGERWTQLNSLLRLGAGLRLDLADLEQDDAIAWERWDILKAKFS